MIGCPQICAQSNQKRCQSDGCARLRSRENNISRKSAAGFIRIGDKLISRERLVGLVGEILEQRANGATQAEVASVLGVERAFVSHLEGLGEVRRGHRIALVGFPISNKDEVGQVATHYGVDFVYLLSEADRQELAEEMTGAQIFNEVLDTLSQLKEYDIVVLLASDARIATFQRILDRDVIGIPLGVSPLTNDRKVDTGELTAVFESLLREVGGARGRKRKFGLFQKGSRSRSRSLRGEV